MRQRSILDVRRRSAPVAAGRNRRTSQGSRCSARREGPVRGMNKGFGASLTGDKAQRIDRAPAKVSMRRNVLDAIGRDRARVFDAYAGPGAMYDGAWYEAAQYTGCDEEWFRDARRVFVADNQVVLRALDLDAFNIFDLDAFGSPWECATIIAARRKVQPGEARQALCLTDGSGLRLKLSGVPHALARLAGVGGNVGLATAGTKRCSAARWTWCARGWGARGEAMAGGGNRPRGDALRGRGDGGLHWMTGAMPAACARGRYATRSGLSRELVPGAAVEDRPASCPCDHPLLPEERDALLDALIAGARARRTVLGAPTCAACGCGAPCCAPPRRGR